MQSFSTLFANQQPTSPMPADLVFHCPKGIHPDILPIWALGKWRKQACECMRQERLAQEQAEKQSQLEKAFIPLCYDWTGYDNTKLSLSTFETFDRSKNPQAFDAAQRFVHNFKKRALQNLLLYGNRGVGKTHLAAAILNALRKQGISGRFAVASELLLAIQSKEEHDFREIASHTPVLVLDDLAQVNDSPGREAIFNVIFNARYNKDLPTIITMNELERLPSHIGEAAASRLKAGLIAVKVLGKDQREIQGR